MTSVTLSLPCHEAGVTLVDSHGAAHSESMMALFERYLDGSGAVNRDEANFDHVREGVVVLLGTLARHMTAWDDKVHRSLQTIQYSYLEQFTLSLRPLQHEAWQAGSIASLFVAICSDNLWPVQKRFDLVLRTLPVNAAPNVAIRFVCWGSEYVWRCVVGWRRCAASWRRCWRC